MKHSEIPDKKGFMTIYKDGAVTRFKNKKSTLVKRNGYYILEFAIVLNGEDKPLSKHTRRRNVTITQLVLSDEAMEAIAKSYHQICDFKL